MKMQVNVTELQSPQHLCGKFVRLSWMCFARNVVVVCSSCQTQTELTCLLTFYTFRLLFSYELGRVKFILLLLPLWFDSGHSPLPIIREEMEPGQTRPRTPTGLFYVNQYN